jgi:DNA mismatch repair ATPase MutS
MRNTDSLQSNTSYFFAELKRLQNIVESIRKHTKSYLLLDEILKGTNSKDQHSGSSRLIENLLTLHAVGIIATHDVELTSLANKYPQQIRNIAFEIDIDGENMIFDYKYKEGICTKMNATHLMEHMNIFN